MRLADVEQDATVLSVCCFILMSCARTMNKPRSQSCRSRTVPFSFERRPTENPRAFQRFARGLSGHIPNWIMFEDD